MTTRHSVCFDRGVCYDDVHVRRSSMKSDLSNTTLAQARGNGSCFCSEVGRIMWGFPKIRGAFLGVPIIRIIVYWGLYWSPPI